uniref:PIN domain-containing protein n=1 Tax=Candidatus Kentrum sp. LPFa TaxID=2126335 RepID=A0A450XTA8_9GAMM|nr:MAG: hypothetical protein BECKLPF1236A_GA0070988_101666 [Candidatus Kentron sp. LPFa]VFK32503.1 MAG: hypothetical protein BECKLPF1236C_GA0070990_101696 [Candidatus Kentron sp. LPFa]
MKVLVDTNVVLDVLLDRTPFSSSAARIFALAEQSGMEGFLCATTVTTIDYFLEVSEKILNKPVPAQGTPRLDPGAKR